MVAAAPTAATAPVATKRKSRRVGCSAEDAVVTIPNPFQAAAGGTAPGTLKIATRVAAGARVPRGGRKTAFPAQAGKQAVQNRSIGTLAGRAQARYPLASVQCTKSARSRDLFRHFIGASKVIDTMQIALFQPDIPQNTGTILRLCACLGVAAHIIEPAGFPISDRNFRRAGMDYLDQVASGATTPGRNSSNGATGATACCCSRPRGPIPTLITAINRPISCCSDANPPGSPTRLWRPPMRGWSSPSSRACARSMWRWRPPWRWARRCGRPVPPDQGLMEIW